MSTYQPGDRTPIRSLDQIRASFQPASPVQGRLGIEWELLALDAAGRMAPYGGPDGVQAALEALGPGRGAIREEGCLTGVRLQGGGMVALEPGAQLEVASPPAMALADLERFLGGVEGRLAKVFAVKGLAVHALGCAPHDGPEDHPDVPKARYAVLGDHLRQAGTRGRRMMKLTAATQFSIDYEDEADLRRKIAVLLPLLPYLVAYSANSPVSAGRRTRWLTQRPWIWRGTDRLRCGLPSFLFAPNLGYGHLARYGLSRPVLMLVREERYVRGDGRSFAQVLEAPGRLGPLTMEDWELHWSTLFPDLRPRRYLEVRVADSVPLPLVMAFGALIKGLLSHPEAAEPWLRLAGAPGAAGVRRAILEAARLGPRWRQEGWPTPSEAMAMVIPLAARGLQFLGEPAHWLLPLEALASQCRCPADLWIRTPEGPWIGPAAMRIATR